MIIQNFLLSLAGYCAITYFVGIGDRHLQNVLVDDTGKFFHIDFGFILGNDPKAYPPPIKISRQMIDALGGINSENHILFKRKCVQAFLYLRKYYKLIINLFQLMIDSGIKDMSREALNTLAQKFCVDKNDQKAQQFFLQILMESENSIISQLHSKIHKYATYWKKN